MSDYIGVRCRGTVEVKKWCGAGGFSKDVNSPEEGAIMHDLVVMYSNPEAMDEMGVKRLNIQKLGLRIQEEDPALASLGEPLHIDKEFLIDFVRKNPLNRDGTDSKAQAKSMKEQIVDLTPRAIKGLKEWIAREHSSLAAGRQRKDLDQIHPPVLEDGALGLRKKIQGLKATISAQNAALKAKDVVLDAALKEKEMALDAALKANAALETMDAALEAKDAALETMDAALETMDAALVAKDVALVAMDAALVAKDAVLQAKNALITSLQEKQFPVDKLAAIVTPFKPGFAEREESLDPNESIPASEPWMEYMDWTEFNSQLSTVI